MTYPPTDPNPISDGGNQYGQPQHGAPQGFPTAPQVGYSAAPSPGYGAAPWGLPRPGSATTAGVLGIVFSSVGFLSAAFSLIFLTGLADASLFEVAGIDGFPLVLSIISVIAALIAAVIGFIGAIQLLSGKSNQLLIIATFVYIGSQVLGLIADLIFAGSDQLGTVLTSSLIGLVLAVVLLFLARSKDVQQWLVAKNAGRAAGHY